MNLALQKAIRLRLISNGGVTALIQPKAIFDRHGLPPVFPSIIIGDGSTVYADDFDTFHDKAFADIHIWTEEPGLAGAKAIAEAVRRALRGGRWIVEDHRTIGVIVTGARFLRDPDGLHAHAVVTVEAVLQGLAL